MHAKTKHFNSQLLESRLPRRLHWCRDAVRRLAWISQLHSVGTILRCLVAVLPQEEAEEEEEEQEEEES